MKKLIILLTLLAVMGHASAQIAFIKRTIQRMYFNNDTTRHKSFVIFPAFTSAPETGIEVGGLALYSFYSDTTDRETRVSTIFPYATLTTKGQSKFSINGSYWTPKNQLHYTATINYINFPFDYFGIGNNTLKANTDHVTEKRWRIKAGVEKRVTYNLYIGVTTGASRYVYTDADKTGIFNTPPIVEGHSGGNNAYIGPVVNFDSRNNNTYTTKGIFINSYYQLTQGLFSSNGYKGGFFNIEYSEYFLLARKLVLGLDVQEQSLTGSQSPFYLLPTLGSDEMMRGYYNGRYRDRNMIAGQAEFRYRFTKRVGAVVFVGTGEVFHDSFSANQLKPDYGAGFRYFFDIEKGLSIRADYGIGQKVPGEQRQSGFYIGLGEAF